GEKLRLMLARQLELPVLVLDFVEQAHVLDRDHRLVGEGGEQLDLLVGERRDLRLPLTYCAERHALAQQGYSHVKLDGPAFERDPADERVLVYAKGPRLDVLAEFAGEAVARGGIIETVADEPDGRLIGMAEPAH